MESETKGFSSVVGTELYMAPEIIIKSERKKNGALKTKMPKLTLKQAAELNKIFAKQISIGDGKVAKNDLKYQLSNLTNPFSEEESKEMINLENINDEG